MRVQAIKNFVRREKKFQRCDFENVVQVIEKISIL